MNGADEAFLRDAPRLNDSQLLDIIRYIQAYNYIELNLRRAIDAFAEMQVLPQRYVTKFLKLRTSELVGVVVETVLSRRIAEPEKDDLLKLLKDIDHGRQTFLRTGPLALIQLGP